MREADIGRETRSGQCGDDAGQMHRESLQPVPEAAGTARAVVTQATVGTQLALLSARLARAATTPQNRDVNIEG